jgi:hypothetical protein
MRTEKSPILISIGDKVTFKWKFSVTPTKPIAGFNIILTRQTPQLVTYTVATNISASATEYEWDTKEYNDNPNNTNQLIEDNQYRLYIFNSNYTYNYAAKFGELMPYSTDVAMYKSKTPSNQFNFSGATAFAEYSVAHYGMAIATALLMNLAFY